MICIQIISCVELNVAFLLKGYVGSCSRWVTVNSCLFNRIVRTPRRTITLGSADLCWNSETSSPNKSSLRYPNSLPFYQLFLLNPICLFPSFQASPLKLPLGWYTRKQSWLSLSVYLYLSFSEAPRRINAVSLPLNCSFFPHQTTSACSSALLRLAECRATATMDVYSNYSNLSIKPWAWDDSVVSCLSVQLQAVHSIFHIGSSPNRSEATVSLQTHNRFQGEYRKKSYLYIYI